jgi:CelD/BcsL family acetyltransferase involved in cellulose biosynthesis
VSQVDVLSTLRPATRRKIRQSLRAFGPLEVEWAETPEHALDIFNELLLLHQARWNASGQPGAFASRRRAAFHREIIPRLLPRRSVILFRVRTPKRTLACLYHFIEQERVLFYQSGAAVFDDNRLRPGFVAHALCMQACAERGLIEYDFLAGHSPYKEEFATLHRELIWATMRRRRLPVIVTQSIRSTKQFLRRIPSIYEASL